MNINDDFKKKCQIFTPEKNVKEMLDWLGYENNLFGKKIIEPSCGQGNILVEIVERYIIDGLNKKYSKKKIREGLKMDIYAIEYDPIQYIKCINNVNKILNKYNIEKINWKIYCEDFLKCKLDIKFDYVVGNPPYISYKMLDSKTRDYIRNNFETCKYGKFDYCYPFIEKSIKMLKISGKIAYLIPGSIFKNVFSNKLRQYLKEDILEIYDYATKKLFNEYATGEKKKILTSSVVFILEKGSNKKNLLYCNLDNKKQVVIKKELLGDKWIFNDVKTGTKRFGDYFKVSNSIATLYNKAYILSEKDELFYNTSEKDVVKIAVSPKSIEMRRKEKIIFPYYYRSQKLIKIPEKTFSKKYPMTYNHLKKYRKDLDNRKSDKNIQWFEYGRSQALNDINRQKLLLSIVVTGRIKIYLLPKNTIPYSGIYIIPKKNLTLKDAKKILESDDFLCYIKSVGINASGESYRITSKDIGNYYFE